MGFKKAGFTKLGFNPMGFRSATHDSIPFVADALHYSNTIDGTTRPDRTGTFDRTSFMAKKFVGDGAMYIDTGIVPNQTTRFTVWGKFNSLTIPSTNQMMGVDSNGDYAFGIQGTTWRLLFGNLSVTGGTSDTNIHKFSIYNGELFIDDDKIIGTEGQSIISPLISIYLFSRHGTGGSSLPCSFDMRYAEITHNGETITFTPEEITDPTDNSQTTFYDTIGTYQAQAFLTHAGWVANSVQGITNSDEYGVTVARALGKNLFNKDNVLADTIINSSGALQSFAGETVSSPILVTVGETYSRSSNGSLFSVSKRYRWLDVDFNLISFDIGVTPITAPANAVYVQIQYTSSWTNIQLELGSTPTAYEAWEGYYKDEAHTIPYADGQPLHALDLQDGTFSRQFCKAWLDTGERAPLDSVGRIKHQVTRTDIAGTPDASGDYIKLAQDYPLVQSADLTDTLVDDHTLDQPTNAVVEVATLNYQIGNQIFSKVDSGDLTRFLVYDREMTNEEVAKILLFMQTGEFAIDSDGDYAIDSNGDMAVAPKSEYYL